jgi:hypothetical protein
MLPTPRREKGADMQVVTADNLSSDHFDFDLVGQKIKLLLKTGGGLAADSSGLYIVGAPEVGDIKAGLQAMDHGGWYLLDGRAVSSLPIAAQDGAAALGLAANLPDAAGRVLRQGPPGDVGGADGVVLTQANLPDVVLAADDAGAHTHFVAANATTNNRPLNSANRMASVGNQGSNAFSYDLSNAGAAATVGLSSSNGAHGHDVPLGGSDESVDIVPSWLGVNWFVYLGE